MNKENRLKNSDDFKRVADYKVFAKYNDLRMRGCPNDLNEIRVGFAITKKIGNSVQRNRIRRRLKAALEPLKPTLKGLDITISAGAEVLDKDFKLLLTDVKQCTKLISKRVSEKQSKEKPKISSIEL